MKGTNFNRVNCNQASASCFTWSNVILGHIGEVSSREDTLHLSLQTQMFRHSLPLWLPDPVLIHSSHLTVTSLGSTVAAAAPIQNVPDGCSPNCSLQGFPAQHPAWQAPSCSLWHCWLPPLLAVELGSGSRTEYSTDISAGKRSQATIILTEPPRAPEMGLQTLT